MMRPLLFLQSAVGNWEYHEADKELGVLLCRTRVLFGFFLQLRGSWAAGAAGHRWARTRGSSRGGRPAAGGD